MCEPVQVEILRRNVLALTSIRPRLVVTYGALRRRSAPSTTRRSVWRTAATESGLASSPAEIILCFLSVYRRSIKIHGTHCTAAEADESCQRVSRSIHNIVTYPNCEQHTSRGHDCCPGVPYCPHCALASQLEVQFPEPHCVGE